MSIYKSEQWLADIDEVVCILPELATLANKSILVTGATGLICSAVVDIIMRGRNYEQEQKKVYYVTIGFAADDCAAHCAYV